MWPIVQKNLNPKFEWVGFEFKLSEKLDKLDDKRLQKRFRRPNLKV